MKAKAYAKVNLTLDILGQRADGYHELVSVMSALDLADTLDVEFDTPSVRVTAEPPLPSLSAAQRAGEEYMRLGSTRGAHFHIVREIPEEAGLGGSSADAAAVLRLMQAHYGALSDGALAALAESIGADVPFCMACGTALCRGKGERIEPLPETVLPLLIVKGKRGVSTRALFERLMPPYAPCTSESAASAIRAGDIASLMPHIANALTPTAEAMEPSIASLLKKMSSSGALASSMTGSGSAVFGVFSSAQKAEEARAAFMEEPFSRVCICGANML